MKTTENLRRYANGERNFSNADFEGQSFKGQDLRGVDFSYSNIQSTDFTDALLTGANFTHAEAGLKKTKAITCTIIFCFLASILGMWLPITGFLATYPFIWGYSPDFFLIPALNFSDLTKTFPFLPIVAIVSFFALLGYFCHVIIRKGLRAAFRFIGVTLIWAPVLGIFAFIVIVPVGLLAMRLGGLFGLRDTFDYLGGGSVVSTMIACAGVILAAAAEVCFLILSSGIGIAVGVVKAIYDKRAAIKILLLAGIMTILGTVFVVREVTSTVSNAGLLAQVIVAVVAVVTALTMTGLAIYLSWQALLGNEKYIEIFKIAVLLASIGGTSFQGADLTEAIFTSATLKNTNFSGNNKLIRTCWLNAHQLDLAIVNNTYLDNLEIRQLVVTGKGQKQNFDYQDLRGLNLQGANLVNASFISANLNNANLRFANLSRTKLARVQLEKADLTKAILTGACIENWEIQRNTKLKGIICDYVYMQLPQQNRMPPQDSFKAGEFTTFIRFFIDTLDIYHDRNSNPQVIISSLVKIAKDSPEPLQVVAIENRESGILIKLKTAEKANHQQLRDKYEQTYQVLSKTSAKESILDEDDFVTIFNTILTNTQQKQTNIYLYNLSGGRYIQKENLNIFIDNSIKEIIDTGGENLNR